jgi:prepilin-type N-terminal cleavage/methylation domain-containing protein
MPRGQEGFTLIEMLVVVVILALVAGLVTTRMSGHSRGLEGRGFALDIAETLRLARAQAIASNRAVTVGVGAEGHALVVDGRAVRGVPAPFALVQLEAREALVFLPDGRATGAVLEVRAGSARWSITVDARTGLVRLPHGA